MSDKTRLENNNLELMNIYNAVENLPSAGGDVKLYDSIVNMNLDHNVDDGQLGIVYYNSSANLTEDSEFQIGTFPETVVLPTAITEYYEVGFVPVDSSRMFDCWGNLSTDRYSIDVYGDYGNIRIQYESSDGITYTRTRFRKNEEEISGDEMDFGTTVKFGSRWGGANWNDAIGYFTQVGSVAFDGLYQYGNNVYSLAKTQFNASPETVYMSSFYGKDGVELGALQNVANLSKTQILKRAEIYASISELDLDETITSLSSMFSYKPYKSVPNIDTSSVTNMYAMFQQCYNLTVVPNFDTGNVYDFSFMFQECNNLTNVPNFNMNSSNNCYYMFSNCYNLTNISNFNISSAVNIAAMFSNCYNLSNIPNFNTTSARDMSFMFYECNNLEVIPNFDTSNVRGMRGMLCNCVKLTSIPNFNTSKVTDMTSTFSGCINLVTVPIFNTSNVNEMYQTFYNCNNLSNESYANIANSLPLAGNLTYRNISNIGLNIENFTLEQKQILGNKGYYDAIPYIINSANVSTYWNIQYT